MASPYIPPADTLDQNDATFTDFIGRLIGRLPQSRVPQPSSGQSSLPASNMSASTASVNTNPVNTNTADNGDSETNASPTNASPTNASPTNASPNVGPVPSRPDWETYARNLPPVPTYQMPQRDLAKEGRSTLLAGIASALLGGALGGGRGALEGFASGGQGAEDQQAQIAAQQVARAQAAYQASQDQYKTALQRTEQRYQADSKNFETDQGIRERAQFHNDEVAQKGKDREIAAKNAQTDQDAKMAAARKDFVNQLSELDTASQQRLIARYSQPGANGEPSLLDKMGFPKDANGQYNLQLTKAPPLKPQPTPEEAAQIKAQTVASLVKPQMDIVNNESLDKPARQAAINNINQIYKNNGMNVVIPPTVLDMSPADRARIFNQQNQLNLQQKEFNYRQQHDQILDALKRDEVNAHNQAASAKTADEKLKVVRDLEDKIQAAKVAMANAAPKPHYTKVTKTVNGQLTEVNEAVPPSDAELQQARAVQQANAEGKDALAKEIDNILRPLGQKRVAPGVYQPLNNGVSAPPPRVNNNTQGRYLSTYPPPNPGNTALAPSVPSSTGAVHHSATQPRNDQGQFNGPPKKPTNAGTPKPSPTPVSVYHKVF